MSKRVSLFNFEVDALDMPQTVERIYDWVKHPGGDCRFVVTPNVDHAVQYQHHAPLREAYRNAALVLADGAPIVAAARLFGRPLPGRVVGSDLPAALFDRAAEQGGLRVYLLGAGPGVAERAAAIIQKRWPHVTVVGTYSPPLGFERDDAQNEQILARIADAKPDVLIVGLGAPKQELWVNKNAWRIQASTALCIGAAIDFLAGEKKRAPAWMRRVGLEWMFRLASEPRRLARRYARDMWCFPRLLWRQWLAG